MSSRAPQGALLALSPLLYAVPLSIAAALVNRTVPEPYLDEIFHIPQAQAYCEGKWDVWDPKLTTPPGLYLVYVGLHRLVLGPVFGLPCNHSAAMRSVNAVSLLVLAQLLKQLITITRRDAASESPPTYAEVARDTHSKRNPVISPDKAMRKALKDLAGSARDARVAIAQAEARVRPVDTDSAFALDAHVIAFLPPLWFFGLLYYTDVCSLLSVIACMLYAKRQKHVSASMAGLLSLLFRQTNIIWVVFILATSAVELLERHGLQNVAAQDVSASSIYATVSSAVTTLSKAQALGDVSILVATYLPVVLAFAGFLAWNGSIVLGDKTNHVAALHFPQLLYFAAFTVIFGWAAIASTASSPTSLITRTFSHRLGGWKQLLVSSATMVVALWAVHFYSIEHPFLLADNRHYAFYIWRRIVKAHPLARYALTPVYLLSMRLSWDALAPTRSFIWMLGFVAALVLTLVPSPLIEPRYFLVPYVIWRAHVVPVEAGAGPRPVWLELEAAWYLVVNAVTLAAFLYKPFKWPSETGWQRFMW
ncbi:hypothetical protein V8E36_009259 [Tilletia maclaganii]